MKTPEKILEEFGIKPNTSHHNYEYLYKSVVEAMKKYAKQWQGLPDHIVDALNSGDKKECDHGIWEVVAGKSGSVKYCRLCNKEIPM